MDKTTLLLKYKSQDLNGDGTIDLAGQGSVYILMVVMYVRNIVYVKYLIDAYNTVATYMQELI